MGAADVEVVEVVLLAVELPVIVALSEDTEEAPTEPCRRLTLVEVLEVVEDEALATAVRIAKRVVVPLTLTVEEYER